MTKQRACATDTGVPADAALPGEAETPITKLFREWLRARTEEDAAFDYNAEDEDACDAAFERRMRIEERMMAEPSRTTLDWIMKVSAYTVFGVFAVDDRSEPNLWNEARALVGGESSQEVARNC